MKLFSTLLIVVALFATDSATALTGTPGDEIIFLNKDCAGAGHTLGGDCFESLATLETAMWAAGGINPTASDPLIVDIGPGTFTGTLTCWAPDGYVTFRGAGRERSIITTGNAFLLGTFFMLSCKSISMQDLTLQHTGEGASNSALLIFEIGSKAGPVTSPTSTFSHRMDSLGTRTPLQRAARRSTTSSSAPGW